ncbi:PRC-barrel domain-containing protein [Ottowia pentelensis]|uniref:PRC-barrel domain-containing protein n=1 Tax=Ottowia pentelensis TaxID=511108 RepID=A0ABV6PRB9_9BURK
MKGAIMNRRLIPGAAVIALAGLLTSPAAMSQVAGSTLVGVSVAESRAVAEGWSVERQILKKKVLGEDGKAVGSIGDLIIAPENWVSYVILDVGGFLGVGRHLIAVPVKQLQIAGDKIVLPGATKDALKALPQFEYARK